MISTVISILKKQFHTDLVSKTEMIQELWSGYGEIGRYLVEKDGIKKSYVVKHIDLSNPGNHPRGWNGSSSHQRKIKSYQVEAAFYSLYSAVCSDKSRIPKFYHFEQDEQQSFIVLEDLNQAGFDLRKTELNLDEVKVCLSWLANFHSKFLNIQPDNLWLQGSYWHLDTRPDEFYEMEDVQLKMFARDIDSELKNAKFKTIIHGDAKLANFCFSETSVAAVDFQYVGGGVGVADVAYFLGSCLSDDELSQYETELLNYYFNALKEDSKQRLNTEELVELETEWSRLYNWCIADFQRFLNGWSPDHKKVNSYAKSRTQTVLNELEAL